MAEFEDKLNAILGNPEAMGQIVNIAKSLTVGADNSAQEPSAQEAEYVPVESPQDSVAPSLSTEGGGASASQPGEQPLDLGALSSLLSGLTSGGDGGESPPLSLLSGLDPKFLSAALHLFQEYSSTDDRKTALLTALKPFLKEERQAKIDQAVKIARLARVIRAAFQLFQKEGGEEYV